jgi:hypothetical protein
MRREHTQDLQDAATLRCFSLCYPPPLGCESLKNKYQDLLGTATNVHSVSLRRPRVEWNDDDSEQEALVSSSDGYDDDDDDDDDEYVTTQHGDDHHHDCLDSESESGMQKGQPIDRDMYLDAALEGGKVTQVMCLVRNVHACVACVKNECVHTLFP